MAVPVPVPKDSLFKLAVDLTKASVKQKAAAHLAAVEQETGISFAGLAKVCGHDKAAEALVGKVIPVSPVLPPVGVPGVPLIKAKEKAKPVPPPVPPVGVPTTIVPVVIPMGLAESILSKPKTGGGWQAIMGELQYALVKTTEHPESIETAFVLELKPALLQKIIDKATAHGVTGGYQGILKTIICLAVKQHPGQILSGKGEQ